MYPKAWIVFEDKDGSGEKYWMTCEGMKTVWHFRSDALDALMEDAWKDGEGKGD